MNKKPVNKKNLAPTAGRLKWLIGILTIFCIILLVIFTSLTVVEIKYRNKILPGVSIGDVKVGGLTAQEAQDLLQAKTDAILAQGLIFAYGQEKINIQNSLQSFEDPDVNVDIIEYKIEPTIKQALTIGHSPLALNNFRDQFKIIFTKTNLPITTSINYAEIQDIVERDLKHIITPAKSAGITWQDDDFTITAAVPGQIIDWPKVFSLLELQTQNLLAAEVPLTLIYEKPMVSKAEAEANLEQLNSLIQTKPNLNLFWQQLEWKVPWSKIKDWLEWDKIDNQVTLSLNSLSLNEYLISLSNDINQPARDAKFEIKNGRVVKFQSSQDGRELNVPQSIELIKNNFHKKIYDNELVITPQKAKVTTADVNNLGIREIIGVGRSDFSGSPANRRHNIKVGAETLNGLLIKPGEEFSLLKALGNIDAEAGYLPELVIKGNETVPEYGGGLCQIGTTTFRATLASGLPVLARRNHSYRVRYYEPAGTDATIYDPAPDYKFLNDTDNYILIQTRLEGNELIFEFWGTNDGRRAEQTEPLIYNITPPPPTKYIETLDLKPGEQKCTENAHAGADAEFTYTVTYANGKTKTETFKSHYRPWGAVCLVGVEELSANKEADQSTEASSTDAIPTP